MSADNTPQRDAPREPMAEDEFVIPCCVDGCKQPSQMPASEYCRVHSYIDATPAAAPADPRPVAWATQSLLATMSAVEKNHITEKRDRGGEWESAARNADRYNVPLYAAAPAAPAPDDRIRSESWDATRVAIPKQRLAAPAPAPDADDHAIDRWAGATPLRAPMSQGGGIVHAPRAERSPEFITKAHIDRTVARLTDWAWLAEYANAGWQLPPKGTDALALLAGRAAAQLTALRATVEQQARALAAMTGERDHWREACRSAMEAGEMRIGQQTRKTAAYKWGYEYLQSRMESLDRHGWAHDCDGGIEARIKDTP